MNTFNDIINKDILISPFKGIIAHQIHKSGQNSVINIMEIIKENIDEPIIKQYGEYTLFSYFIELSNKYYESNYTAFSKEDFDKIMHNNKVSTYSNKYSSEQPSKFSFVNPNIVNFIVNKVIDSKILENIVDFLIMYDKLIAFVESKLVTKVPDLILAFKIEIFKNLSSLFKINLPTNEFDFLIFDIASKVIMDSNGNLADIDNVLFLIKKTMEQLLSTNNYSKEFRDIPGIIEIEVAKLLIKYYDFNISINDLLKNRQNKNIIIDNVEEYEN